MAAKYDSVRRLFSASDSNLAASTDDQDRINAYNAYEGLYWNNPNTYQLVKHGEDQNPFYLPPAKKMVESTNRFLAVDFEFSIDPIIGSPQARESTDTFLKNLFKRERFASKFAYQKRFGLVRGDAIWHFIADKEKPAGRRMTIQDVKPHNYFPILDPEDPTRLIGCHLVNKVPDPKDPKKSVARRQTYRKILSNSGDVAIESSLGLYELGKWDDRNLEPGDINLVEQIKPPFILPDIKSLPVYHIPNTSLGSEEVFGNSLLRGIEGAIIAVNQSVSDEDLALLMQGLGVFWTTAGPPKDAEGNDVPFNISPATMLELPGDATAGRLSGVSTVAPMLDHMNFILDETQSGVGVPDIAAGKVEVTVAESGISLTLQMSPILAGNAEKERDMLPRYDNMIFDLLNYWLPSFEDFNDGIECEVNAVVGNPLPENRSAVIDEIITLRTPAGPGQPALITLDMAVKRLESLGWEYPPKAIQELKDDAEKSRASTLSDPFAGRLADEQDPANGTGGADD